MLFREFYFWDQIPSLRSLNTYYISEYIEFILPKYIRNIFTSYLKYKGYFSLSSLPIGSERIGQGFSNHRRPISNIWITLCVWQHNMFMYTKPWRNFHISSNIPKYSVLYYLNKTKLVLEDNEVFLSNGSHLHIPTYDK